MQLTLTRERQSSYAWYHSVYHHRSQILWVTLVYAESRVMAAILIFVRILEYLNLSLKKSFHCLWKTLLTKRNSRLCFLIIVQIGCVLLTNICWNLKDRLIPNILTPHFDQIDRNCKRSDYCHANVPPPPPKKKKKKKKKSCTSSNYIHSQTREWHVIRACCDFFILGPFE